MSNQPKIAVVTAGLSDPSSTRLLADHLAEATRSALAEQDIHPHVDVIELRALAVDIANMMITRVATPGVRDAIKLVTEADAIIAVTPTFAMSYSGLFKSFFDVIENGELEGIPVLLAATGGSIRHSMVLDTAMRPLFAYLKGNVISTGVFAASEDWGNDVGLEGRIRRAGRDLASVMTNLPRRRAADPFDPDSDGFESFEQLMGGHA